MKNLEKSEVYGTILDHKLEPKPNVFVEAYQVSFTPPIILPLNYYLGMTKTNQHGKFKITFPTNAYGVIGRIRVPNIALKVNDSHRTLYKRPVRFLVIQNVNNDFGDIIIPEKFEYSDKISHVDWKDIIETYLPDIMGKMDKEEIAAIIPEYLDFMESQKYLEAENVEEPPIDYRGIIVPKRPKYRAHRPHLIPWFDTWRE